jgi:hypothetical protein
MQDPTDEIHLDKQPEEQPAAEEDTPAEESSPAAEETVPVEEAAIEIVALPVEEEPSIEVAEEEPLPQGPSFGEQLQESLTVARERVGAILAPLGEQLGRAFAPLYERFGNRLWIYGGAIVAAIVIIVVVLQALGIIGGYQLLNAKNNAVYHPNEENADLVLSVDPNTFQGRIRMRLSEVPRDDFLGFAHSRYRSAAEALLGKYAHLQAKSQLYLISTKGKPKQPIMIDVAIPNAAEPWETLDLYTWTGESWKWVGSELHTENREREFIRARVTDVPKNLLVVQAGTVTQTVSTPLGSGDDLAMAGGAIDEVNPTGLMLGPDGSIIGNLAQQPSGTPYAVVPTLRNWTPDGVVSQGPLLDVMANAAGSQDNHIANIVEMCTGQGFAGAEIDYRGITAEEREAYTDFIAALAESLHAAGLRLTVVLEPPANVAGIWDTGGYDWVAIGAAADAVKVVFPDDPAAYAEGGEAQQFLNWAKAQVPRQKMHMQVASLSVERCGGETTYISMEEALAPIGKAEVIGGKSQVAPNEEIKFQFSGIESIRSVVPQEAAGTYRIEYGSESETTYTVWLGTAANLAVKLQWAQRYHLGGVSVIDMLNAGNAPGIINAVAAYRSATTPPAGQDVQVVWTVTSAAALINQQTKPLNDPDLGYTWLVMAATDTYTVKAEIAGYDHGSVPVVVAEVSPTPIPSPVLVDVPAGCLRASFVSETVPDYTKFDKGASFTKSWTLLNSGTCDWPEGTTLVKISSATGGPDSVTVGPVAVGETVTIEVEMAAPDSDGAHQSKWSLQAGGAEIIQVWAVVQVGEGAAPMAAYAPAASGRFELGGHVKDIGLPYADKMRYAGMTWAKVQVRYPQDATGIIQAAHSKGFKIQLSALGTPGMVIQSGFEQQFANWVAGMASAGADAIEVWNEPNLDREWQAGYIDPAAYTRLLCTCYNAIKAANASTIVISAATAPTGYYGGCGPNGCDDLPFLQGMYNAGASQCMDYVGAHHNSGATSPSARSGHPADDGRNHHSWYFLPQTEKYYAIFGKQLYYTEMGYASQEGLPTFSEGWAWARGVNNAQQAAWLSEAVQLSINTGMVRCVIIWNLDFTRYGDDPQDGYAIIRPGGSCPACDSLHNVLGSR